MTTKQPPNYRIYDRTGGGVEYDIYAASLEDAIEQGREWIEDGEWSGDKACALRCEVREIVYAPDLSSIEALPGVYDVNVVDGVIVVTIDEDESQTIIPTLPITVTQVIPDDDGTVIVHGTHPGILMMIDREAVDEGEAHDCSGRYVPAEPECKEAGEHDWQSPFSLVAGCRENPGVWASGHGATKSKEVCASCGMYRTVDFGATDLNDGSQTTETTYCDADAKSLAWIAEQKEEVES